MMGDYEAAMAEQKEWSPARAHDDAQGPRCGREWRGRHCFRPRGHEGDHLAPHNLLTGRPLLITWAAEE